MHTPREIFLSQKLLHILKEKRHEAVIFISVYSIWVSSDRKDNSTQGIVFSDKDENNWKQEFLKFTILKNIIRLLFYVMWINMFIFVWLGPNWKEIILEIQR